MAKSFAVIGGGLAGLSAATRLAQKGASVVLFERSRKLGGVIDTSKDRDGFLHEKGANSFIIKSPAVFSFLLSVVDENDILRASSSHQKRYIGREGRLRALNPSNGRLSMILDLFLNSDALSTSAKMQLLMEAFRSRNSPLLADPRTESVESFLRRRFGEEITDELASAFLTGIYAAPLSSLGIAYVFPEVYLAEARSGSVMRGLLPFLKKEAARVPDVAPRLAVPCDEPEMIDHWKKLYRGKSVSFTHGMKALPDGIARHLLSQSVSLLVDTSVSCIERVAHKKGFRVTYSGKTSTDTVGERGMTAKLFDGVIIASSLNGLEATLGKGIHGRSSDSEPLSSSILDSLRVTSEWPYAPIRTLGLGFRNEDILHPLDGFGYLCSERERERKRRGAAGAQALGALFNSSIFGADDGKNGCFSRAPNGHSLLTTFHGGLMDANIAEKTTTTVLEEGLNDLTAYGIIKKGASPVSLQVTTQHVGTMELSRSDSDCFNRK